MVFSIGAAVRTSLLVTVLLFNSAIAQVFAQQPATGGFVEHTTSPLPRTVGDASLWQQVLPQRGPFIFPEPYLTRGVRLTNASDCGGANCVVPIGYSYWRNANAHMASDTMLVVLSLDRRYGGTGPTLFTYNKNTGATANAGPLFGSNSALGWATGEGWYFSAVQPTMLYVNDGARMSRVDVVTKRLSPLLDLTPHMGPGHLIWQMHSSHDDRVHSFTVRDGNYRDLGCGVYVESSRQFRFHPARGEYDECQVDASGRFLVVKENADGVGGFDNVIYDLSTGASYVQSDPAGALGHSDLGFGYGVGEDNWHALPNAVRVWTYAGGPSDGRVVFHATNWDFATNHISHTNARSDLPIHQQMACSSSANRKKAIPRANEVVCFLLDGSNRVLVVAPVMTDLNASGGGDDYSKQPKGNLDITGDFFLWTSNMGGSRVDAFMVHVPRAQLGATPPPVTPAVPPSASGCRTVRPSPAWSCHNGGWLPPGAAAAAGGAAGSSGGVIPVVTAVPATGRACTTVQPGPKWTCHAGGWLPPGAQPRDPVPVPQSAPPQPTSPGGCATVRPGPAWVCRSGSWLPPNHPGAI